LRIDVVLDMLRLLLIDLDARTDDRFDTAPHFT
jgi:hypothetical protein